MVGAGLLQTPFVLRAQAAAIADQHRRRDPGSGRVDRRQDAVDLPARPGADRGRRFTPRAAPAHDFDDRRALDRADEHDAASCEGRPLVRSTRIEVGGRLSEQRRHPDRASGPPLLHAFVEQRSGNRQPNATFDRDQPALPEFADTADIDAQRNARRRTHGVLPQHSLDDDGSRRRDTIEPSGQRRSIDPGRIARAERQSCGDCARNDQRRGFPAVVQQERSGRRQPEQQRAAGGQEGEVSRQALEAENCGGRTGQQRKRDEQSGDVHDTRHCKEWRASEQERNGERAGQTRRRCDPVTPCRWQFLRGTPAARGRSGPRCGSP